MAIEALIIWLIIGAIAAPILPIGQLFVNRAVEGGPKQAIMFYWVNSFCRNVSLVGLARERPCYLSFPIVRFWPKAATIQPSRMGPLTGEHRPRIRAPGRWSARPSR
jgi:hypothetical protein